MYKYPFSFPKISGHLIRRINRFVAEVQVDRQKHQAYLANPGRLWEILLPGTELLLSQGLTRGKLPYTILAGAKEKQYVLLHTHLTNKVVHSLIDNRQLNPFKDYRVIKEEPTFDNHRFDLLLQHLSSKEYFYLEIKSCTLFSGQIAMFPDAVTKRGAEHLYKLQELALSGIKAGCLFVVMNPETEYFMPSYHIDPHFAGALLKVKDSVRIDAMAIGFDQNFEQVSSIKDLNIPNNFVKTELLDRGSYMLIIKIESPKNLKVGSLGQVLFAPGYYIYVGSAMKTLSKRVSRHIRKGKQKRWHVDYLISESAGVTPVQIVSSEKLECQLAASLERIADRTIKNFGSSDCHCQSHLFYFLDNPLHNPLFIGLIQHYRIGRIKDKLP